jgi:hypothetical protein
LTVVERYPAEGAVGVSTHTTLEAVLYQAMPIVRLSISPEVPLERIDDVEAELVERIGEVYLYRPLTPLLPDTSYEVTVEIGRVEGDTVTRTWTFTTSGPSETDFAGQVVLPLLPNPGRGGLGAVTGGELTIEGRCLYLDNAGIRTLPIFEEGAAWWEGDILFLRGHRHSVGDVVSLGGGETKDISGMQFVQGPDSSCDLQSIWVNSG